MHDDVCARAFAALDQERSPHLFDALVHRTQTKPGVVVRVHLESAAIIRDGEADVLLRPLQTQLHEAPLAVPRHVGEDFLRHPPQRLLDC